MRTANDIRILQAEYNSNQSETKARTIIEQIVGYVRDNTDRDMELSYVLEQPVVDILIKQGFQVKNAKRSKTSPSGYVSWINCTVISW